MKKVLIVDDNKELRELYKLALTTQGILAYTAEDGEAALAALQEDKPDLIMLDIMMPKIQGLDVLDIIKSTPDYQNIQILMLTALSQSGIEDKAQELGASALLVKSEVSTNDVVAKVVSMLDK